MLTNAMPLSLFVTLTLIARTLWVHTVVRAKPDSWVMEKLVEVKRHINSYRLQCNARTLAVKRERRGGTVYVISGFSIAVSLLCVPPRADGNLLWSKSPYHPQMPCLKSH